MSKAGESRELYTVPEIAELAGVSKQAVYDRIKKDLAEYVVKESGRTLVDGRALQFIGTREDVKRSQADCSFGQPSSQSNSRPSGQSSSTEELIETPQESKRIQAVSDRNLSDQAGCVVDSQTESQVDQGVATTLLDYLIKENARLLAEIERMNGIIQQKDDDIRGYAEKILGLTEQFSDIAEREQEISSKALSTAGQAQMLHAMSETAQTEDDAEVVVETITEKKVPWWKRKK